VGAALENVKRRVSDRNFNNDIVNILKNLKRYKLEDKPIDVGNSTFDGAILEFTIAIVQEMDEMANMITDLKKTVAALSVQSFCDCKNTKEKVADEVVEDDFTEDDFVEDATVVAEEEPAKEPKKPAKKGGAK
jgi:hypothetical protein